MAFNGMQYWFVTNQSNQIGFLARESYFMFFIQKIKRGYDKTENDDLKKYSLLLSLIIWIGLVEFQSKKMSMLFLLGN